METCRAVNRSHPVAPDGANTNNAEAAATQSSTNGLGRNISVRTGKPLSENLDKSRTSEKCFCDRISGLWLIRKIIAFFKKLFNSGEATDSATAHKYQKDNDPLVLDANSLSSTTFELDRKIRTYINLNDNLPEIREEFENCVSRLDQLQIEIASAKKSGNLKKTVTEIEQSLEWIKFCITDAETDARNNNPETPQTDMPETSRKDRFGIFRKKNRSGTFRRKDRPGTFRKKDRPRIVVLNRGYYDDFVELRYEKAKEVLRDHKPQLAEIEAIREQYKQSADALILNHNGNNFTSEIELIVAKFKYDVLEVIYHIKQQGQRQN